MPEGVLRFLTCGSVDDGKSTLIGRLMYDGDMLVDDQRAALQPDDNGDLDYALLLDGLEAERAQQITIDVAWRYVASPRRRFIIADAPGHEQYLRNMATAAAASSLAVLLVDATKGPLPQTRRHAAVLAALGVGQVILAVNKMDLAGYDEAVFTRLTQALRADLAALGLTSVLAIPVSARRGDNVAGRSAAMPWYLGPDLLSALESAKSSSVADTEGEPGRMPIDWVDSSTASRRRYAGSIACGAFRVGEAVSILPADSHSHVAAITTLDGGQDAARPGEAVMLELADLVDAGPGDVICTQRPVLTPTAFEARLIWLADAPPNPGGEVLLKLGCRTLPATVAEVIAALDLHDCVWRDAQPATGPGILRARLALRGRLAMTRFAESRALGQFLLIDRLSNAVIAVGVVDRIDPPKQDVVWQVSTVDRAARSSLKPHAPCLIWFTGLPAAGKSTIADRLEVLLHARGVHTMSLDGDNLRHGLCRDLGFSAADRVENIRRVGETAKLMLDAGLVAIAAFVSPYRSDRDMARALCPPGGFVEVYVNTPLRVCQERDPKGLYQRAAAGILRGLTGVDAPYEPPLAPELELMAAESPPEELAARIVDFLRSRNIIPI